MHRVTALRAVLAEPAGPPPAPLPRDTQAFHARLPGYGLTRMVDCPAGAEAAGIARLVVKDESRRFGLPAFKYLGASWALARLLGASGGRDELAAAARTQGIARLAAATDGNHGRAVARLAAQLGIRATIYVPEHMVEPRRAAIAGEGAELVVVQGGYDDAVRVAAADGADPACRVLADADHDGSSPVPGWVIEGYATLFAEARQKLLARRVHVDVVMLQTGVGALARPGSAGRRRSGPRRSRSTPPVRRASPRRSPRAGRSTSPRRSPRWPGWTPPPRRARPGRPWRPASRAVVVDDDEAAAAQRLLATCGLDVGESGAAGVAGLVALGRDSAASALRERVGLGAHSVALAIATEGPTGALTGKQ